jgi:hypothetical protein
MIHFLLSGLPGVVIGLALIDGFETYIWFTNEEREPFPKSCIVLFFLIVLLLLLLGIRYGKSR